MHRVQNEKKPTRRIESRGETAGLVWQEGYKPASISGVSEAGEVRRKIETALSQRSAEAIGELSEIIPETYNLPLQRDAVSALIGLAQDNNEHAISALAQMLPFMIADADRKEAMKLIEDKWSSLGNDAKGQIRSSLELHMMSGALSHWAVFPERRWAKRLLE
jgi:hypothetical protein